MTTPVRLQLSRRKGYSLQAETIAANGLPAVKVARPSVFGNPFTVEKLRAAGYSSDRMRMHAHVVSSFRSWLDGSSQDWQGPESDRARYRILSAIPGLAGKNLACFCRLDEPCHADVLLEHANRICREVTPQ